MALSAAAVQSQVACIHRLSPFSVCCRRRVSYKLSVASLSTDTPSASSTNATQASSSQQHRMQDKITLTDEEQAIFDTLLAAAEFAGSKTVLRAAGGWVRDKLLGKESKDIDIALDNMLGKNFADKVNEYLAAQGKETHSAAVIQSNPDQSKHLETARMKVNSLWIDLVNLRSETYADSSRIPTMEFGTPLQDAERRDFTINSLFYNLNEGVVEDFTGKGLEDLRQGILRTPLPPQQTFLDDPLRVMRAVRFATRFGFAPEPAILEAASSEEVRCALSTKVSRERIGTELQGMLDGVAPTAAMRLLQQLQLFSVVFAPPPHLVKVVGTSFGAQCVEVMAAAEKLLGALDLQLSLEERRLLLVAALLLPLRQLSYPAKGNKQAPASSYVIRDSIKWRNKDVEGVALLHAQVAELASVHKELAAAGPSGDQLRVQLGRAIRQLKATWKLGVLLVPLLQLSAAAPLGVEPGTADAAAESPSGSAEGTSHNSEAGAPPQDQLQQQQAAAQLLLSAASGFGLDDCWQWKPLLGGKELIEELKVPKGPQLGQLTTSVMDWQLAHPTGSKEECLAAIKQQMSQASGAVQ